MQKSNFILAIFSIHTGLQLGHSLHLYYVFTNLYYVHTAVHRLVLRLELQKTAAQPKPLIFHLVTDSQQTK